MVRKVLTENKWVFADVNVSLTAKSSYTFTDLKILIFGCVILSYPTHEAHMQISIGHLPFSTLFDESCNRKIRSSVLSEEALFGFTNL